MRNITLCLVVGIIVSILSSCEKATEINKQRPTNMSSSDLKIEQQVMSFKERMASSLKSTDSLSVDSTIWYLEMTANYTYGDASVENEDVSVDSAFITLPIENSLIAMDDIDNAYVAMIDSVRVHYNSIDTSEKHLLSVDVRQVNVTSSELILKVVSTVVSGPYPGTLTFQPWESWMYGNGEGMCNGQFLGRDAATEIARKIMLRKGAPLGNYYYEPYAGNPVIINADFYPIPGIPPSNTNSHYMWWENSNLPNFHLCLPSNELNFYLTGTEYIIYEVELPSGGYSLMDVSNFEGSLILNSTIWVHTGEINYGILHQSTQPPEDL